MEFQAAKYPFSLTSLPVTCGSGIPPQRKLIMGEENCWMVHKSATVVLRSKCTAMGDPPVHRRANCPEVPGGSHALSCQDSCYGICDRFSVANSLPSWATQGHWLHITRPSPSACTLWLLTPQGANQCDPGPSIHWKSRAGPQFR